MDRVLGAALEYIPRWLEFQLRASEMPGVSMAIAHRGRIVLKEAFGHADLARGEKLTTSHRFRVASHSKTFTSTSILKLRELGKVRLDDPIGQYVSDLHPRIASATINQLLTHSAGLFRDGMDSGAWADRRRFSDARELRESLKLAPTIDGSLRLKYSNPAYGLLGLVIESITGESFRSWIDREVIAAAGLKETLSDAPLPRGLPFARGHSSKLPLGHRVVIPGDNPTNAIAPAAGVISTAADLALFFDQLAPTAKRSILSTASRRELVRPQWRDLHTSQERSAGLGVFCGTLGPVSWFGGAGSFQGYVSLTLAFPQLELAISALVNASDGPSHEWVGGAMQIIKCFKDHGLPTRATRSWTGRWWSLWGSCDLLPVGNKVLMASPESSSPVKEVTELAVSGKDIARVAIANGLASHAEEVRRVRDKHGRVSELWVGGMKLLPEADFSRELETRYRKAKVR